MFFGLPLPHPSLVVTAALTIELLECRPDPFPPTAGPGPGLRQLVTSSLAEAFVFFGINSLGVSEDLLDELRSAYAEVISHSPGFIAGALHVNDAQTRIANYSQWRRREDFQAMLRSDEMRERNRRLNALCKSFEPVMYEVAEAFGLPAHS